MEYTKGSLPSFFISSTFSMVVPLSIVSVMPSIFKAMTGVPMTFATKLAVTVPAEVTTVITSATSPSFSVGRVTRMSFESPGSMLIGRRASKLNFPSASVTEVTFKTSLPTFLMVTGSCFTAVRNTFPKSTSEDASSTSGFNTSPFTTARKVT